MRLKGLLVLSTSILLFAVAGCGKPTPVEVKGTVTFNSQPAKGCRVMFFPDSEEPNFETMGFGSAMTDDNGNFSITATAQGKGVTPGKYKVCFEWLVDGKGKPLGPTDKPSEVPGAKNLLPEAYVAPSTTPEKVSVPSGGLTKNFDLKN
jgi:hypothetical protein